MRVGGEGDKWTKKCLDFKIIEPTREKMVIKWSNEDPWLWNEVVSALILSYVIYSYMTLRKLLSL